MYKKGTYKLNLGIEQALYDKVLRVSEQYKITIAETIRMMIISYDNVFDLASIRNDIAEIKDELFKVYFDVKKLGV